MDYKSTKLYTMIRQFDKASGKYEINGIEQSLATYLYRRAGEAFIPIPKGNYRISTESNNLYLNVDEEVNSQAVEFQIIYESKVIAEKYEDKFPELAVLVQKYNNLVDGVNNIITHIKTTGIKADSLKQTQLLTPLEPLSIWYMTEKGEIDTLSISDFKEIFERAKERIIQSFDSKASELEESLNENAKNLKQEFDRELESSLERMGEIENHHAKSLEEKEKVLEKILDGKIEGVKTTISEIQDGIKTFEARIKQEFEEFLQKKKEETEQDIQESIDKIPETVLKYISDNKEDLKGPKGATGERGLRGEKGPIGEQGPRGVGITSVAALDNNRVIVRYGDGESEILTIPTVSGKDGHSPKLTVSGNYLQIDGVNSYNFSILKGERGPQGTKGKIGPRGEQGVGIKNITYQSSINNLTLDFELTDNTHKQVIVDLSNLSGASGKVVKDVELITTNNLFKFKITYSDETSTVLNLDEPIAKALQELMEELPFLRKDQSGTLNGNLTVQGSIYAADNVTAYSDIRLKKNIKPIGNALDKVLSLTGYTFDMNGKRNTGVIAQELRKVLPEAVVEDDKGYLSVAYGNIVGLLINAIKEQQRQIDELRGEKHGTSN